VLLRRPIPPQPPFAIKPNSPLFNNFANGDGSESDDPDCNKVIEKLIAEYDKQIGSLADEDPEIWQNGKSNTQNEDPNLIQAATADTSYHPEDMTDPESYQREGDGLLHGSNALAEVVVPSFLSEVEPRFIATTHLCEFFFVQTSIYAFILRSDCGMTLGDFVFDQNKWSNVLKAARRHNAPVFYSTAYVSENRKSVSC
jgi:hypothetical protein